MWTVDSIADFLEENLIGDDGATTATK